MIGPYGVFVRPAVHGMSRLAEALDTSPFDEDERKAWTIAGGAYLYQEGLETNALLMLGLCAFGTIIPRFGEKWERSRARRIEAELLATREATGRDARALVHQVSPAPAPESSPVLKSVSEQAARAIGASIPAGYKPPETTRG